MELTKLNFDNFVKQGRVLVDFWSPRCGPCKMLVPVLEEIFDGNVNAVLGKVNTDLERDLAMKYNIMSIPTLVLFENGLEVERYVGLASKDLLTAKFGL